MRIAVDLPHLKPATATSNAKYRRRVPQNLRGIFRTQAVEWWLKTKDPMEVIEAWKVAHARFEAMAERGATVSSEQIKWEMAQKAAIEHGLASPRDTQVDPVDPEGEQRRFTEFTQAILAEADRESTQQMNAALSNGPAATPFDVLLEAKFKGIARPPVSLQDVAKEYLKDREARATYDDISKQVGLVIRGVEEAVDQKNPTLEGLTLDDAYLYRVALRDKGNFVGTIESFNGKLRDECLNETLFGTLGEARKTLEEWQEDYNWRRPHSALGNLTPMEFLQRKDMDKMAA